jgi:protein-tyrosine phosphatase
MLAEIYEITPCPQGRLAIMPRPRGGGWLADEMASLKTMGVTDLVSMLPPEEEWMLELSEEAGLCVAAGIRFHHHPIPDRGLPEQPEFDFFLDTLEPVLRRGGFVAIHCRGGIGRSSVVAAALLVRLGVSAVDALAAISLARGFEVPDTEEQREYILQLR